MFLDHMIHKLDHQHRLSHACSTKEATLTSLWVRRQKVDRLNTRDERFCHQPLFAQRG